MKKSTRIIGMILVIAMILGVVSGTVAYMTSMFH